MLLEKKFVALTDSWTCDFGDETGQHNWVTGKEYEMSLSGEGMFTITSDAGTSTVDMSVVNTDMIKDLSGIDISEYMSKLEESK